MDTKVCRTCEQRKNTTEFRKAPTRFGGDGFSKSCKACCLEKQQQRKAEGGGTEPIASGPDPSTPQLKVGPTLGFRCWVEAGDVVIEQESGSGTVTIWLTHAEIAQLTQFSADNELKAGPTA